MIGRFCRPEAYEPLIIPAIRNELASQYPFTQCGALRAVGYLISGTIEGLPPKSDL